MGVLLFRGRTMATIAIAFVRAMEGGAPILAPIPTQKQSITSSAVSQQSTAVAGNGDICQITASGGKVWAQFGANPTASVGNDFLILDGQTREFGFMTPGHKVALIDG